MADRYTGVVKGPAAIFPRGYLLLIPLWYAAAAGAIVLKGGLPDWYTRIALGALLLATIMVTAALLTLRQNAFSADATGVWLGRPPRRKRFRRDRTLVPWSQIELIRVANRRYGAQVEVVLGPAASIIYRHKMISSLFFAGLTLVIPPPWLGRPPGVVSLRSRSHRFKVPICDINADQLGLALAALAPPTVSVGVAVRRWSRTPTPAESAVPVAAPAPAPAPATSG
jgi:hypothetical protein